MTMTTTSMSARSNPKQSKRMQYSFAYFTTFLILGIATSAFGTTLPDLADQTGSTLRQISVIFSANALGYILGSLLGGWLFDRRQGHPVLANTLITFCLLFFILPLVPSLWLLVTIIGFVGFGMGIIDVGGNTLIVWLFGRDVGPYMNTLHLSFGVGALLSPLLVDRVVISLGEIRWVYWILAFLIVPIIFWLTRIPSPDRPADTAQSEGATPVRRNSIMIILISGLFFLHVGTELGFGGWIYSYAVAVQIGPDTAARLLNAIYWGGFTLGRLISIPLAIKLRPQTMILIDLIGALASFSVLLFLPAWPPAIWAATFGLGLSVASLFPSSINLTERLMPITGRVTSYLLVGGNAGSMIIPWFIGQMFETEGPQSMVIILAGAIAIELVLFLGILLYSKQRSDFNR